MGCPPYKNSFSRTPTYQRILLSIILYLREAIVNDEITPKDRKKLCDGNAVSTYLFCQLSDCPLKEKAVF